MTRFNDSGIVFGMMSKDERINYAIELVNRADDTLGDALRMLSGLNPLAAEHIVDAQYQYMDAVTHMQTRPLKKNSGKKLTNSRKRGRVSA